MSSLTGKDEADVRALTEAAAWRAHLHETSAQSSEAFEAWLAGDARNEAAWRRVCGPWDFFGEHATSPELMEARCAALGRAQRVVRRRWRPASLHGRMARYAVAATVLLATASGLLFWNASRPDVYQTAPGERRVVTLVDGSQLTLDSRSEVSVRYTEGARNLTLVKGQARFDVAHDVDRPFSVLVADQKVIATGTAFNVDLMGRSVFVTLIEGRIVVLDKRPEPRAKTPSAEVSAEKLAKLGQAIELTVGQQLMVAPAAAPSIATVNLERTTAWQNGQLVFEDEPLSTVVARVNRYSAHPLALADEKAAALRISGVFNTGDLDGFISTITHYLPVDADQTDGAIRLTHRQQR